ncbi:MAG: (2Fe-2S)-binding protein [Gammaproteobacteria bacterium]|nr:(2Fe-2S)-binding protein [Gammaproteobacteria bacterium]|tara:strand:+ start:916 stop:2088 length:1173 start_codon:yes stop_codon:yes gene_type:complete
MSAETISLVRRALTHYRDNTTDQAPGTMQMPVDAYLDPNRYAAEVERIFKHLPLALALSLELPEPGSYRALTMLEVPVLMVRGEDGVVRAFLNVCRHRGAKLCPDGADKTRLFSCPYHAWSYNHRGELVARYAQESFGEVDAATHGLTELACAERSGLIWVSLTPGEQFDVDQWLGDFAAELDTLDLANWHLFEQRVLPGPGWKVTMDGYLEAYHHNVVHGRTVGQHTIGNLLVLDTYGPHQRLTFGRKTLSELEDTPESEWNPLEHVRLIHSGFPNLSISGILGDHCLVSHIIPGPTPETTTTRQSILVAKRPETPAEIAASENFSAMVLQAVQDEDYGIGLGIQACLDSGANRDFVFGRNEPALQNYHKWVARFMNQQADVNWSDSGT